MSWLPYLQASVIRRCQPPTQAIESLKLIGAMVGGCFVASNMGRKVECSSEVVKIGLER